MLETGNPISAILSTTPAISNCRHLCESSRGNLSLPSFDNAVSLEKIGSESPANSACGMNSHLHRSPNSLSSESKEKPSLQENVAESRGKNSESNGNFVTSEKNLQMKESLEYRNLEQSLHSWENLLLKETQLMEQMKVLMNSFNTSPQASSELQRHYKFLGEEINSLVKMKNSVMCNFFDSSEQIKSELNTIKAQITCPNDILAITQQPADIAIANRYMWPAPAVNISPSFKLSDQNGTLIVTASLFYHTGDKGIKTLDVKQEILQGVTKVPVDKDGMAAFNKLKITEVSSKHRHQAFCIVFSLEEYNSKGRRHIISSQKSNHFFVQSRANGKKCPPIPKRRNSDSNLYEFKKQRTEVTKQENGENSGSDRSPCSPVSEEPNPIPFTHNESTYIDITDLLTLPQKDAAQQLGISESMLCKRFKECTKRKWPYRYLRKIDKVITMLKENKSGRIPQLEDRQKLEKLEQERLECLRPVKIRITVHDRLATAKQASPSPVINGSPPSSSSDHESPNDDELEILQTLQLLKRSTDKLPSFHQMMMMLDRQIDRLIRLSGDKKLNAKKI